MKMAMLFMTDGEKEIIVLDDDATEYDAKVYNVYGIGAFDSNAIYYGARRAYNEGWTSVSKAIVEGAQFVAENYIYAGQDTLYEMRWNPDALVDVRTSISSIRNRYWLGCQANKIL